MEHEELTKIEIWPLVIVGISLIASLGLFSYEQGYKKGLSTIKFETRIAYDQGFNDCGETSFRSE